MADEAPRSALSILLVDDHADSLELLARLLRRCGHTVQTARTVGEARRAVSSGRFDVLVSDIALPDGSGTEVMTELRAAQGCPGIALTGHGEEHYVKACEQAGFSARLLKPVVFEDLVATIESVVPPSAHPVC